jgi:hypothetical protein
VKQPFSSCSSSDADNYSRMRSFRDGQPIGRRAGTKCVLSDMETLKIQTIQYVETKSKNLEHFKMITVARIH